VRLLLTRRSRRPRAAARSAGCTFARTGWFGEPHPHLTVGYRSHASFEALRAAEAQIVPRLPVVARTERVHLLAGSRTSDSWRVVAELPLTGA
jgi:hypothetical protein